MILPTQAAVQAKASQIWYYGPLCRVHCSPGGMSRVSYEQELPWNWPAWRRSLLQGVQSGQDAAVAVRVTK